MQLLVRNIFAEITISYWYFRSCQRLSPATYCPFTSEMNIKENKSTRPKANHLKSIQIYEIELIGQRSSYISNREMEMEQYLLLTKTELRACNCLRDFRKCLRTVIPLQIAQLF